MSATTVWRTMFALDLVLLTLLALAYPFQPPGSAARTISLMAFVVIVVSLLGLGLLIRADWDPF
ncbi:hypothetical protein [Halomarina pelagica]|uniref:hypothetical protein n=1 Tax=Halomarina pelagica TaxID=2961599 RepID=UPI0020C3AA11|nr:hypothetical protein [Halomarina sp. BND7]